MVGHMRTCGWCEVPLEGKRPHAVYCSRTCKTKASDQRRKEDGRSVARDRARYAKEADHRREYARRYLAENPDRMREIRRKRKAKTRGTGEGVYRFTDRDWARLVNRYGGRCAYCGQKGRPPAGPRRPAGPGRHPRPGEHRSRVSTVQLLEGHRTRDHLAETPPDPGKEVIPHLHPSTSGAVMA